MKQTVIYNRDNMTSNKMESILKGLQFNLMRGDENLFTHSGKQYKLNGYEKRYGTGCIYNKHIQLFEKSESGWELVVEKVIHDSMCNDLSLL